MHGLWWGGGPWFWGPGWWPLGPLLMLVFWAIMIGLVVGAMRRWGWGQAPRRDSALEILRMRYAKGEIARDEFEAMRRDLVTK